jgi:uncharacterized membrane protein YfcA
MSAIVPTAVASLRAHHLRHAVLWPVVFKISPGVLLGTFIGTFFASYLSAQFLAIFFSCFMGFVAMQMVWDRKPKPSRQIPNGFLLSGIGSGIGGISALVAVGGGTLTVPFLSWCNVTLPVAIGTSAAIGLPIAVAGAIGYLLNGLNIENLPAHSVGFIYWPAVMAIAAASFITAPMGAQLAHRLPVKLLKKLFSVLLIILALQMLFSILGREA